MDDDRKDHLDHDHKDDQNECAHDDRLLIILRLIYLIAIILWIVLVYLLGIKKGWFILIIPIIVYAINSFFLSECTKSVVGELFRFDCLAFAALIAVIIITTKDNGLYRKDQRECFIPFMIAIILLAISMIDLWVSPKYLIVWKHIRSILQTAAITLLIYSIYIYFRMQL